MLLWKLACPRLQQSCALQEFPNLSNVLYNHSVTGNCAPGLAGCPFTTNNDSRSTPPDFYFLFFFCKICFGDPKVCK